ncbi:MAG: hypothetical protein ACKV19_29740 [Verrucomicrobiales bacterium]
MKTFPHTRSRLALGPLLPAAAPLLVALGITAPLARAQNTPPPPAPERADRAAAAATPAAADTASEAPLDPLDPSQLNRYGIDRYERIKEKSPFSFKIVREEGPPPVSFAADLALAGYTVDSGKGITYASIVDKKSNNRFVIRSDRPNDDGIQLVQLNPAATLLDSSVLARKGAEEAQIKSDKQIIERKAVVNAAVVGQPAQAMQNARGAQPGTSVNLVVNPRNNVQGQINNQLNVPNQQPGQPGQPGAQPGGLPHGAVRQGGNAPATAGDLSVQAAQPQQTQPQGRGERQGQGQAPGRRRVILPPAPQ